MNTYFLVLTLFFPRLTLLVSYLNGWIPPNTIAFWGDALLSVLFPRVLVLIYIYQNIGMNNVWFWVHVIALVLAWGGGGSSANRRRRRERRA